jgi:hypothetical protein
MCEEKTKRAYTEQPKLSNVTPMDEWGENKNSLNGTTKIV